MSEILAELLVFVKCIEVKGWGGMLDILWTHFVEHKLLTYVVGHMSACSLPEM